jgi:DNA-binding Lrp family transcriptional regulator
MSIKSNVFYIDELDQIILEELQTNGRIRNVDLARRIHLSAPATYTRTKRLEDTGYIRHYSAILDREKLGYDMLCFVSISLQLNNCSEVSDFRERVSLMPEVMECYHITGEFNYLLKVAVRNRQELEHFMVNRLVPLQGVSRIDSSLVLSEVKSTIILPVL